VKHCVQSDDGIKVSRPTAGHLQLEFSSVTADDAGNYTCTSRNSVGVDEEIALLTVQCRSSTSVTQTFSSSSLNQIKSGFV